jgi:hypothetical protein
MVPEAQHLVRFIHGNSVGREPFQAVAFGQGGIFMRVGALGAGHVLIVD